MKCPTCGTWLVGKTCTDSRPTGDGRSIRRRRECQVCAFRFTTYEVVVLADEREAQFPIYPDDLKRMVDSMRDTLELVSELTAMALLESRGPTP